MKLVEILARRIDEWNDEWIDIQQVSDDGILVARDANRYGVALFTADVADDVLLFPLVTRAQWEAERARIAADVNVGQLKVEVDESELRAVSQKQYEQELWDKVAIQVFAEAIAISATDDGCAIYACNAADAFLAERAKRMKG